MVHRHPQLTPQPRLVQQLRLLAALGLAASATLWGTMRGFGVYETHPPGAFCKRCIVYEFLKLATVLKLLAGTWGWAAVTRSAKGGFG